MAICSSDWGYSLLNDFSVLRLIMKNKILTSVFLIFLSIPSFSQCAMCRAVLESSENDGMAEGINNGIMYLAFLPYLIVFFMIFFVYKKFKK